MRTAKEIVAQRDGIKNYLTDADYINAELALFGEVFTDTVQCACTHVSYRHTRIGPLLDGIPTRSKCTQCECNHFAHDNLEWLVKNR